MVRPALVLEALALVVLFAIKTQSSSQSLTSQGLRPIAGAHLRLDYSRLDAHFVKPQNPRVFVHPPLMSSSEAPIGSRLHGAVTPMFAWIFPHELLVPPHRPREFAVVLDVRNASILSRAKRIASGVFETLRAGDRAALVVTAENGHTLVPLLTWGAAPLLIERTRDYQPRGENNFEAALRRAVNALTVPGPAQRIRKLVILTGANELVEAEHLHWIEEASRAGIDVVFVPLSEAAVRRFEPVSLRTQAIVMPEVTTDDRGELGAIDELSSLPPAETAAEDMNLVVEALPGPSHVIEVAGATHDWTPSGGEVPLGSLRVGDARTVIVRMLVPRFREGAEFHLQLALRYRDANGPHELRHQLTSVYTDQPREYASSRNGDVLQHVSLLNTLSNVQAAYARGDGVTVTNLREAAVLQARSLQHYAQLHRDTVLAEHASLLEQLLASYGRTSLATATAP